MMHDQQSGIDGQGQVSPHAFRRSGDPHSGHCVCGSPRDHPDHTPLTLPQPQHAPSGEQPGKTHHLGHVPGTVIVDEVELAALRAELAQRTAELARLRASANEAEELDVQGNLRAVALEDENDRLTRELAQAWQQRDQYLTELQQARAVVLAARELSSPLLNRPYKDRKLKLQRALAALDHSPAVGEMQNRL